MRKVHLVAGAFLVCLGLPGCDFSWSSVQGSGREARETREVTAFTAVHVADSLRADVTLAPDAKQLVEVSGDDNLVPEVRARVEGSTLILDLPPSFGIHPKLPLVITVSATALTRVEASDSATLKANHVDGGGVTIAASDSADVTVDVITARDDLTVRAQDSAMVTLEDVTAGGPLSLSASDSAVLDARSIAAEDALSVTARGSSEVVLQGEAPSLVAELRDSSHLDAKDLTVADASVHASSSSDAEVCATATLDVTLRDSSAVGYSCDPDKILQDLDDSSTLSEN